MEKILWSLSSYNEEAFILGQKSNFEDKNPFLEESNEWYNWNRGKNTNNN